MPVGFQKMQKLWTICHPKSQDFGILILLLDYFQYASGDIMQEQRQFLSALGWLQIWSIMCGCSISVEGQWSRRISGMLLGEEPSECVPGTKIECVYWSQFEVRNVYVQIGNRLPQEFILMGLWEFENSRQNGLLAATAHVSGLHFRSRWCNWRKYPRKKTNYWNICVCSTEARARDQPISNRRTDNAQFQFENLYSFAGL